MVRLTERFIFLPMSREVLGLAWTVERVRTRSVERTFSSAAARACWAFFSSLTRIYKGKVSKLERNQCFPIEVQVTNTNSLLQESVFELFSVELNPQLIGAHSGCSEEHWVLGEVRG